MQTGVGTAAPGTCEPGSEVGFEGMQLALADERLRVDDEPGLALGAQDCTTNTDGSGNAACSIAVAGQPPRPEVVLEVAFDSIQHSGRHLSGYALRFPRIVRIREDKPVDEIDTVERVSELYERYFGGKSEVSLSEVAET